MLDEVLFKSGEFARMCGTTKETLRHYRDVGLLEPAFVEPNGYCLYSAAQLQHFAVVAAMRSLGCSLPEINQLMREESPEAAVRMLRMQRERGEAQMRDLRRRMRMLDRAIEGLEGFDAPADIEEGTLPPQWFAATPIDGLADTGPMRRDGMREALSGGAVRAIFEHLRFCDEHALGDELPSTYRVGAVGLACGDYSGDVAICSASRSPISGPRGLLRPAGVYLSTSMGIVAEEVIESIEAGRTPPDPFAQAFELFDTHARAMGRRLAGDMFVEESPSFSPALDRATRLRMMMRVEPAE